MMPFHTVNKNQSNVELIAGTNLTEIFHRFNKIDLRDLGEADSCSDPEDLAFSD
jgi:hypothetical protein